MSLLGFSFGFGARDEGMDQAMDNANSQLEGLNDAMENLSDTARSSNVTSWMQGLQSMQLGGLQSSLDQITGGSQNLTNSLEATFHAMRREVAPAIAQMGLSGDAAKAARQEITAVAHSSQLGASQVAATFRALSDSSDLARGVFSSMGLGLRELAELEQSTGITTDQLTANVSSLADSYQMSEEATASFLDQFTATAQAAGVGHVAFGNMNAILQTMDNQLSESTWFQQMDLEEQNAHVTRSAIAVVGLSGAFKQLGKTPEEAMSASQQFFQSLTEADRDVGRMMTGMGDMGESFQALAQHAGVEFSSDLFRQDPRKALTNLAKMRAAMIENEQSTARFDQQMNGILPNFSFMADGINNGTVNLEEMFPAAEAAGGALTQMGRDGHDSSRTLDESFGLIQAGFESRLLRIGGGGRNFVRHQRDVYKGAGDAIEEMASDKTWGPLVQRFSLAARLGNAAFFLPIREGTRQTTTGLEQVGEATGSMGRRFEAIRQFGVAGIFLDTSGSIQDMESSLEGANEKTSKWAGIMQMVQVNLKTFTPVIVALGGALFAISKILPVLISGFKALFSIVVPVVTAIAAVVGWPVIIGAAIAGALAAIWYFRDELSAFAEDALWYMTGWIDEVGAFFRGLDGEQMAKDAIAWVKTIPKKIADFFSGGGDGDLAFAASAFGSALSDMARDAFVFFFDFFGTLGTEIGAAIRDTDWNQVATDVGDGLNVAFNSGVDKAVEAMDFMTTFSEGVSEQISSFDAAQAADDVKTFFGKVGDNVGAFILTLPGRMLEGARNVTIWMDAMLPKLDDMGKAIGEWFEGLGPKLETFLTDLFTDTGEGSFFDDIDWGSILEAIWETALNVGKALAHIGAFMVRIVAGLRSLFPILLNGLIDGVQWALGGVKDLILSMAGFLIDPIFQALGFDQFSIADWFDEWLWNPFMTLIDSLQEVITTAFNLLFVAPLNFIMALWDGELSFADAFSEYLWTPFVDFLSAIGGFLYEAFDFIILRPFRFVWELFSSGVFSLGTAFANYVWNPLMKFFDHVATGVRDFFNDYVLTPLESAINSLISMANTAIAYLPGVSYIGGSRDFELDMQFDTSEPVEFAQRMASIDLTPEVDEAAAAAAGQTLTNQIGEGIRGSQERVRQDTRMMTEGVMEVLPQSPPADPASPLHGLGDSGRAAAQTWGEGFAGAIPQVQQLLVASFNEMFSTFGGSLVSASSGAVESTMRSLGGFAGKGFMEGFSAYLMENTAFLTDEVVKLAERAIALLPSPGGQDAEEGPFSRLKAMGESFVMLIAQGISSETGFLLQVITDVFSQVGSTAVSAMVGTIRNDLDAVVSGVSDSIGVAFGNMGISASGIFIARSVRHVSREAQALTRTLATAVEAQIRLNAADVSVSSTDANGGGSVSTNSELAILAGISRKIDSGLGSGGAIATRLDTTNTLLSEVRNKLSATGGMRVRVMNPT